MDMFGVRMALRAMISRRTAARRIRQMERVHLDLPANVRLDMGLDQNRKYFVARMLNK